MRFPEWNRVTYDNNPLTEVVGQVTFPRLLELEQQLPVELQKELSGTYPLLETRSSVSLNLGSTLPPNLVSSVVYDFLTRDRNVKVSLASTFIAVMAATYVRWQDFRPHLDTAVSAVIKPYSPPVFTRIGLRYVNAIEREKIGLGGVALAGTHPAATPRPPRKRLAR